MTQKISCTELLLTEIEDAADPAAVVPIYAHAIKADEVTDWQAVNNLARRRWGASGLESLKKMAWNRINGGLA